ncbi:MAG: copper resistance protein CopC [Ktedonobacteraceae bacterium]
MKARLYSHRLRRFLFIALPLALGLAFFLPGTVSAHAILLRSEPAKDAVLNTPPQQVRMWFSEDLNPAFTTAVVVNANNQQVDQRDAHISSSDSKEMDVSLRPNLPPAVYVVIYRTDSADDGHILRGSFIFSVARADGTVPSLNGNSTPGQNVLGGGNLSGLYTGQLDGPTVFNLIMITLVELGAVFWVGAQLWLIFVLQLAPEHNKGLQEINQQVQERFEQRWSLPTLLVLLIANVGVLVGQGMLITGGQIGAALSPQLLNQLTTSGRFGTYWTMREIVIVVALVVGLYMVVAKRRPRAINSILPSINLLLGCLLFIAIAMSSHASAVSSNVVVYAVLIDWLHLLAAALWVGGMLYIATIYLPVLRHRSSAEQAHSLITLLPYFTPLAIAGVVIMAVTGPFSATIHLNAWQQLLDTAYGRALIVKIILVGALLITSAIHVGYVRPRLRKEYKKYTYALEGVTFNQAQQVKLREGRLTNQTRRLSGILRWEPLLGVVVIVCVGLMNVFAGTLTPTAAGQSQQPPGKVQAFNTSVHTTDNKFTVKLNVNPNRFGTNTFTTTVIDNHTGKPTSDVGVSLYTTMLDMDMGTDSINLLPDGKGNFSGHGDLSMSGDWQIRIQIRTADNNLHEATAKLYTPF